MVLKSHNDTHIRCGGKKGHSRVEMKAYLEDSETQVLYLLSSKQLSAERDCLKSSSAWTNS